MASIRSSFSTGLLKDHLREWIDKNCSHIIPVHLADLARRAHVDINKFTTPQQRGQCDKNQLSTPTAADRFEYEREMKIAHVT